jgi:hypothetical protein
MDDAHWTVNGLDLYRHGQGVQYSADRFPAVSGQRQEPATTIALVVVAVVPASGDIYRHLFTVAAHGMEPWLSDPVDRLLGPGAAIHQTANAEQPAGEPIELDVLEHNAQIVKAAVQVADDRVATLCVLRESLHEAHAGGLLEGVASNALIG